MIHEASPRCYHSSCPDHQPEEDDWLECLLAHPRGWSCPGGILQRCKSCRQWYFECPCGGTSWSQCRCV